MLDDIKNFVAVVRSGSFTQAAETLDISRSVISKKISSLETTLGVRLLNRTTRRLSLTEAGELFYQHCRQGLQHIDEAIDEIHSLSNEPRGRLYVNLPMSFGILHIAPLIAGFLRRYPGIQVDMNFEDRKVEVIEPGFDVSIRIADLQDSSLSARRLAPCRHVVVAAPDYLKEHGKPESPLALQTGHTIASYRLQESSQEWLFSTPTGESLAIQLTPGILANNSLALREIILAGGGIARMPSFIVGQDLKNGSLVNLFPELSTLEKTIYAIFPKKEFMPSKTRAFIDFLVEKISDPPRWDNNI